MELHHNVVDHQKVVVVQMVRIAIYLTILSLLISCNNGFNVDGPFCSQPNLTEEIPETSLKTRTFYRVTTENTTNKFMTWSYKSHPKLGHRYIVSDQCKRNRYTYDKGGQNYYHAQWFFLPAKGHAGWYHFANRGVPGEFAAWSYKDDERVSDSIYYLILDPTYAYAVEDFPRLEYLFKPVKQGSSYKLKLKALPGAFVTTIPSKEELEHSDRWLLIAMGVEAEADHYKHGGKYFSHTLFNFEPILNGENSDEINQEYLT